MTSTSPAELVQRLRDHHERFEQMLATVTLTSTSWSLAGEQP